LQLTVHQAHHAQQLQRRHMLEVVDVTLRMRVMMMMMMML
jgi:hypothetical protein